MANNSFTNEEYVDMLLIYGEAGRSTSLARQLYRERYPGRRVPHSSTFEAIRRRLAETGSFRARSYDRGRQQIPGVEDRVLGLVADNPRISTRRIAVRIGVSNSTVHNVLRRHQYHPYHFQPVQGLEQRDYASRNLFCEWLLNRQESDREFISKILFTDEATFTKDGVVNFHNLHLWADENPRAILPNSHQYSFKINIWCGIIGGRILGPVQLPVINGNTYLEFLRGPLEDELDEHIPLALRRNMWFMHDGAPAHFSVQVRQYLNEAYGTRWIGRGGPCVWPARSPDLNPLDFYLWGHLKDLVYGSEIRSVEQLWQKICTACDQIRNKPRLGGAIKRSLISRAEMCVLQDGGHVEHLI